MHGSPSKTVHYKNINRTSFLPIKNFSISWSRGVINFLKCRIRKYIPRVEGVFVDFSVPRLFYCGKALLAKIRRADVPLKCHPLSLYLSRTRSSLANGKYENDHLESINPPVFFVPEPCTVRSAAQLPEWSYCFSLGASHARLDKPLFVQLQ